MQATQPAVLELAAPEHLGLESRTTLRQSPVGLLEQLPERTGRLVIDLRGTRTVDSAGLGALRTFRRFVTEGGMQMIDWEQSRQQFGAGKVGNLFTTPAHLTQVTGLVGGIGVGIQGNYAVLWFGDRVDSSGTLAPCATAPDAVFAGNFE